MSLPRVLIIVLSGLIFAAGFRAFCMVASIGIVNRYGTVEALEQAIEWDATNPQAHYLLGLTYRDDPQFRDLEAATRYLRNATELNPFLWEYWLELARVYEVAGEASQAEQAYLKAVEINPRAGIYRWRVANFFLREGELEKALEQFQATIELDRSYLQQTLLLLSKAGVPLNQIVDIWPVDKRSRLVLLRFLVEREDAKSAKAIWKSLREVPDVTEGDFYLRFLLKEGAAQEAKREWIRLNGIDGYTSLIWNGDFELPDNEGVFAWQNCPRKGGEVELEFEGTKNVDYHGLQQLVPIMPGQEHQLTFRARSQEISTEQGLFFEVLGERVHAQTDMVLGTTGWLEYSVRFFVPEEPQTVIVRLRRRPSKRIDNKLKGLLWIEWVKLEPTGHTDFRADSR